MSIAGLESACRAAMVAGDWAKAERLGRLMDTPPPVRPLGGAALWYAEQGAPVFPLVPGRKTPLTRHGLKDATCDIARVSAWWAATPQANVGIRTGVICDVIDLDGLDGVLWWASVDDLPPLIGHVSTPRPGGHHLWIDPTGLGNAAGMADGVDYRGAGGYVVAPPSVISHPDEKHHGTYRWIQPPMIAGRRSAAT